jgi:SAM-dependent methyltransferase
MTETGARDLKALYEEHYSAAGSDAELYGAWRALGARGKADHVEALARALPQAPASIAEIGCGDGSLLGELALRGFGTARDGFELSEAAARIAARRDGVRHVEAFDGVTIPAGDSVYDLAILSHVLEHVPDPAQTLAETARVARAVIIEVPLEDNRSARRISKAGMWDDLGHLHHFSRASVAGFVHRAGLRIEADLTDPLPRAVHLFFARTRAQRARAELKAAARGGLYGLSPRRAERLFTVHYAALCLPAT